MSMEVKPSQASQPGAAKEKQQKMSRSASKASVTPSQMSERARSNMANQPNVKDPIDALSRMTPHQMAERRCGLQDVDEDYLKNVVYAFAGRTKTAAAQRNEVRADMMPAGVPTTKLYNPAPRIQAGAEQQAAQPTPAAGQQQTPQQQQPPAANPAAVATEKLAPPQSSQPSTAAPPSHPASCPGQSPCSTDPEMYTTCPNCRATLYLVRNAGDPSPYGEQPVPPQQQQQQRPYPTAPQQGQAGIPATPC